MILNTNFRKLDYLTEDSLSQKLNSYQFRVISFGIFKTGREHSIKNTSLPYHRIIYLTKGPIRYTIHGTTLFLAPGDVLYTPPNILYSASGETDQTVSEFLYLYFTVQPHHKDQDFIKMMESADGIRAFHGIHSHVEFYFHTILEEYEKQRPGYYQKIHSYLTLMVMEILRNKDFHNPLSVQLPADTNTSNRTRRYSDATVSNASLLLNKATSYIAANLNDPIRISTLSQVCGVSENYLYKIFKAALHISPQEYVIKCKMEYAVQLLQENSMTITQISRELGFSNPNHFSNAFFKVTGMRPSQVRTR